MNADVMKAEMFLALKQLLGEEFDFFEILLVQPGYVEVRNWTWTFLEQQRASGRARVNVESNTLDIDEETLKEAFEESFGELYNSLSADECLDEGYRKGSLESGIDAEEAELMYLCIVGSLIIEAARTALTFQDLDDREQSILKPFRELTSTEQYPWLPPNASAFGTPNGPLEPFVRFVVLYARRQGIPPDWAVEDEEEAAN